MDRKGRNKQEINPWQYAQHVWLYTDLLQALKGERLNCVFSPDGTLISASAAPTTGPTYTLHCDMTLNTGTSLRETHATVPETAVSLTARKLLTAFVLFF